MNDHEKTREYLINELKKEIIGPEPIGEKKELSSISFDNLNEPFTDLNGQEILIHERPSQKYGAGILFPKKIIQIKVKRMILITTQFQMRIIEN